MGKYIRTFVAIFVLFGLLLFGKNHIAWAANPFLDSHQSALNPAEPSASQSGPEDCSQEKEKCKDKEKEKDKCKNKHHDCGTVKPPDDDFDICEPGDYSVGGAATVEAKKLQDRRDKQDCFHARSQSSDGLSSLPKNAGPVLSDLIVLTSVGQGSTVKICFAAAPGKHVKIYSTKDGSWKSVGTQVKNGVACAQVQSSGSYVLLGK